MIPANYDLDDRISDNPGAQVWTAKDPFDERIMLKLSANATSVERRFKREIDALKTAEGHHVMPVLDCDETYSWYSMPIATHTLHQVPVPAPMDDCLAVLEAVTTALQPIHDKGQVHRDLKPQNILWLDNEEGARWVVADFGIVRNPVGLTTAELTHIGGLTGTKGWAAPEQYNDAHSSTITADVYAAGAIFAWMLTGTAPNYGHVVIPAVKPQLKAALKRATNADPTGRYSNLKEFLKAVKDSAIVNNFSLKSLVQAGDWPQVSSLTGQPEELTQILEVLPTLQETQVKAWFISDRANLISAVIDAWNNLRRDTNGRQFSDIDRFLAWGVVVLRVLVSNGDYDAAERVGTSLFRATTDIHQFQPAKAILNWLSGLNKQGQDAMETALHESGSWDFFRGVAKDRWPSNGENELVRLLRG